MVSAWEATPVRFIFVPMRSLPVPYAARLPVRGSRRLTPPAEFTRSITNQKSSAE